MGVVLNALLAWPECCFRPETVRHPHTKSVLASLHSLFGNQEMSPKEEALLERVRRETAKGRRTLVYTTYTGTRDTSARLKALFDQAGVRSAVLRSSVAAEKREDWVTEQVDRGINALICHPELVKTGLDMLEFPTILFMHTGYNVYTLQQAARRSWRIGQTRDVDVDLLAIRAWRRCAACSSWLRKSQCLNPHPATCLTRGWTSSIKGGTALKSPLRSSW